MSRKIFIRDNLTGGTGNDLDGIDGNRLAHGNVCFVKATGKMYSLDATLGEDQNVPLYIRPLVNPGTKVWVLQNALPETEYPYSPDWVTPSMVGSASLTVPFPAFTIIWGGHIIHIEAFEHTFAQGRTGDPATAGTVCMWIDQDGAITYEEAFGDIERHPDQFFLCQVITWPADSVNEGIWTIWRMCDTRPVHKHARLAEINLTALLDDYYIFPHTHDWGAGGFAVEYRDCIKTSTGLLYLVMNRGTLAADEPTPPWVTWEPYGYGGWGDIESGTAIIRFIGSEYYEGAFRQGLLSGVHNVFGLDALVPMTRLPLEFSKPLAPYAWEYIKNLINRTVVVWQASHTYKTGMLVTGDYRYGGWVWRAQGDGTSGASCAFVAFELEATSFVAGAGATEWTAGSGWTLGAAAVHTGAASSIVYNTPFTAETQYVVTFETSGMGTGAKVTVKLGGVTRDISYCVGTYTELNQTNNAYFTSPSGSPQLEFLVEGDATIDDVRVYPRPVPGTTTKTDNDIAWQCVGRTSFHKPHDLKGNVDWTIMDVGYDGNLVTAPDSHDASAWGLTVAVKNMIDAGTLPDEFFYGYSVQRDFYNNPIKWIDCLWAIIYDNIILQFNGHDGYSPITGLCCGSQYGYMTDGSQGIYPYYLFMDSCGGWGLLECARQIWSDPRAQDTDAGIAYIEAWRYTALIGNLTYWNDTAECWSWAMSADGLWKADPTEVETGNVWSYPWVSCQFTPAIVGMPVGYDKLKKAALWADTKFPDWWRLVCEGGIFLIGAHHYGALITDHTDLRRQEMVSSTEKEKFFSLNQLTNTKQLSNLLWFFLIKETKAPKSLSESAFPCTGIIMSTKTTTGDLSGDIQIEKMTVYNSVDKTHKIYLDGGWRTLASW